MIVMMASLVGMAGRTSLTCPALPVTTAMKARGQGSAQLIA